MTADVGTTYRTKLSDWFTVTDDEMRVTRPDHISDEQWARVTAELLDAGWERVED